MYNSYVRMWERDCLRLWTDQDVKEKSDQHQDNHTDDQESYQEDNGQEPWFNPEIIATTATTTISSRT